MSRLTLFFSYAAVILCLLACENKKIQLQPRQDPYLDAFRNRNIKYMLTYLTTSDSSDFEAVSNDTTTFDRQGNFLFRKAFMHHERRQYDSLNFLTRMLVITDGPRQNYTINYYFDSNSNLVQEWFDHKYTLEWSLPKSDTGALVNTIKYELDDKGRVIKEIGSTGKVYSIYLYDTQNKLSEIKSFKVAGDEPLSKSTYTYDEKGLLKKIVFASGENVEREAFYYTDGLLDSARDSRGFRRRYEYIYYSAQ